ncbi:MAG: TRAP transporter permease [Oscillospiraceae bacterium]|nr:TRAP transporter permease [Oscillospiraceae bacterium]
MTEHEDKNFEQEQPADIAANPGEPEMQSGELLGEEEAVTKEDVQRMMAQIDRNANTRHYSGVPKLILRWLCVAFTVYMLLLNTVWLLPPQIHRASFVAFLVLLTFLLYPARKKNNVRVNYVPWYDLILAVVGMACFLYYAFNFRTIVGQMATFTQLDFIVAVVGILILFYACYRVVGMPLLVVVAVFLAYAYFGRWIPGTFGHAGYRVERIFTFLFYTTEGVLGTPTSVAASFLFVFLLFGAFLEKTGIGAFFIDISNAVAGRATGGPAKVVVVASALYSTVSGSSVANTVASGTFTIPMMKRLGYNRNFAGAVEAAASTGGQLMPPIMGAAAFLMAEITGIPYVQIALAALIPAILYFVCIFASVHFEAKRIGLRAMPEEEIPKAKPLLLQKGHLFLAVLAIVVFLALGFTPARSALIAIGVAIFLSLFRRDTNLFLKDGRLTFSKLIDALETGARNTVGVGMACAMAGLIIGVVVLTGLGLTFANAMVAMANVIGNETLRLIAVLFFCMVASLVLGLGVPTTAKYVIMATVTAPILIRMDVPILVAHMFVFYFGTDADITPPAGLASYAASAISRGSPLRTSVIAMRLAAAAYIIPYLFVFNPQILFIDATAMDIIVIVITGTIGIIGVASALSAYLLRRMGWPERIVALAGGVILCSHVLIANVIGIALIGGLILFQIARNKRDKLTVA